MSAVLAVEHQQQVPSVVTPMDMLQMAVSKGADLQQLQQLMDLQERWEKNQARKAFNESFANFKAEAVTILKNRSVNDGPLRGKKYAELFSVVNAATPALSRNGLSASWKLTKDERDWIEVTCTVTHIMGHSESVSMSGPPDAGGAKNAIQARASTITYLERYTLKAVLGLAEQEQDTDGNTTGGMDEGVVTNHIAAIQACADTDSLKKAYEVAYKAASEAKDRVAQESFIRAKDARKKALTQKVPA